MPEKAIEKLDYVKSLPDIYRQKTPSLAKLRREMGEDYALKYLMQWIILLNKMVNVGNKMQAFQVKYTAKLIMNENPLLTIADIKYVFDRAVSGHYGELYNRLDSAVMCRWFRQHWDERLDAAGAESETRHSEKKEIGERTTSGQFEHKRFIKKYQIDKLKNLKK